MTTPFLTQGLGGTVLTGLGIGQATSGGTLQAQSQMAQQLYQAYSPEYNISTNTTNTMWINGNAYANIGKIAQGFRRVFHRINQEVAYVEGAEFEEPLDELRIKVAKWLRRDNG